MLIGQVETCTAEVVSGWALRPEGGPGPVLVDISIDGRLHARLTADLPREIEPFSRCGFRLLLPPEVQAGRRRAEITASFAETGEPLANSPRKVQFGRRAKRVICFIAAGRVVNHDNVIAYQRSPRDHIQRYMNTGDAMVYDSSLKLLSYSDLFAANLWEWTDRDVETWNAEYDYCFIRGSNYLHEEFDWQNIEGLLAKLKIPVVAFSVGAQAPARRKIQPSQKSIDAWKAIAGHSATLGVRGAYSAEVFNDLGIRNVEIIGCPSVFRRNDPWLRVNPKPIDDLRKVAFSLRREVSSYYAADTARYLAIQKRMMLALDQRFDLTVTVHGEAHEKAYFYKDEELLPKYRTELIESGWFDGESDPLEAVYRSRLFYNEDVAGYDAMVRRQDLAVGFRVHGTLPAMGNGVPAICVDYDTRSRELADALDIPTLGMDEIDANPFEALYEPAAFDRFNRNYPEHYRRMAAFLDRNGLAHNMIAA